MLKMATISDLAALARIGPGELLRLAREAEASADLADFDLASLSQMSVAGKETLRGMLSEICFGRAEARAIGRALEQADGRECCNRN